MTEIVKLEHVGVAVSGDQLDAVVGFYEQVFGWHRIKEAPGELVFIGDGDGGRLEIFVRDCPPLPAPHHLAFVVAHDQFDATTARIVEAGGQLRDAITNPFGDRLQFFSDPAGNAAQICGRVSPLAP
jgi:predicted enzyme related to lactoylglutathione lyase